MFLKREAAAAAGSGLNTSRSRKRQANSDDIEGVSSPTGTKMPEFLNRPASIEEDSTPFEVQWGLRNKDTAVGDTRASMEWSKHVVTPRDRAQIVESSNDLQLESMLSQAVATVRIFICELHVSFLSTPILNLCLLGQHLFSGGFSQPPGGPPRSHYFQQGSR